jgi:protoporphyrinogen oxidase
VPVELGASFFAGFYTETTALLESLGIGSTTQGDSQETWVTTADGRIGPVWPAKTLATTPVVGLAARLSGLRGLLRLVRMSKAVDPSDVTTVLRFDDATVATWARKAFGAPFSSTVIEPLLRALFFWDPEHTSRALLPLILRGVRTDSRFLRVPTGMSSIADALADIVDHRLHTVVSQIDRGERGYLVAGHQADAVVLACPADVAAGILSRSGLSFSPSLADVGYSSIRVGVMRNATEWPLSSRRTLVFTAEASEVLIAIKPIFAGDVFHGVRVYLKETGTGESTAEILPVAAADLERSGLDDLVPLIAKGELVDEVVWSTALPLFDVGYPTRVAQGELNQGLAPGVFLAGDYTTAPHLEGAVSSGNRAAEAVLDYVRA